MIFDLKPSFVHPSELHGSEVYVPESIVDLLETDVLSGEGVGHADPIRFPPDAAVAADEPDFEVSGVFERKGLPRKLARRRVVDRGGSFLAERLVGPLVVVLGAEPIEADLPRVEVPAGRSVSAFSVRCIRS